MENMGPLWVVDPNVQGGTVDLGIPLIFVLIVLSVLYYSYFVKSRRK